MQFVICNYLDCVEVISKTLKRNMFKYMSNRCHPYRTIKNDKSCFPIQHRKIAAKLQQYFFARLQHCSNVAKCCCNVAATVKCPPLEIL